MIDRGTAIPSRPQAHHAARSALVLSVVIATRNEVGNVEELLRRLGGALGDTDAEVLFVDDSDDKTPDVIEWHAAESGGRVRLLHRGPAPAPAGSAARSSPACVPPVAGWR